MISGEPIPVEKGVGATVIGGTVNGSGSFRFEATGIGDSMWAMSNWRKARRSRC